MRCESGIIDGDIEVRESCNLSGTVTGNIVVTSEGVLQFHGLCVKDVIVRSGGTARLYGLVSGDAINEGGLLEIHGIVQGAVRTVNGTTVVSPDAIVMSGASRKAGGNRQDH
ncbi:MAG: hypothetical protein LBO79_08075 [Zoogloeaceae bacterium]|jgi:hypothetical protein|nr:hypothetical protein [Zoogloeaceae bacterium]